MGTWGTGVFQNDSGADAVNEILKSTHPAALIEAWFDDVRDADYKFSTEEAVAAAAVLDYFLNSTDYNGYFTGGVENFRYYAEKHRAKMEKLRVHAIVTLCSIVKHSTDNWNPGMYEEWKSNVRALQNRLYAVD